MIAFDIYHVLHTRRQLLSSTSNPVPLETSMTATSALIERILIGLTVLIAFALYDLTPSSLLSPTSMPPKPKLNVHNFPRPPLLEKTPRHLQIKWQNQVIADTNDAYWVLETTHPPSKPYPPFPLPILNLLYHQR